MKLAPCSCIRLGVLALQPVLGTTANAQSLRWTATGAHDSDDLGASVRAVPDVDGDGVPDVLAGAPGVFPDVVGQAYLFSGATETLLQRFDGDAEGDRFGSIVADLGDVDGDGVRDFAFAAPWRVMTGQPLGAIFVDSGTGSVIRVVTSASSSGQVGLAMSHVGDVDGDGVRDLLYNDKVGSKYDVVLASGASGAIVRTHTSSNGGFGAALGRAGDVDGDGIDDYMICEGKKVSIYSGADGSFVNSVPHFASVVGAAGDFDVDGSADLILADPAAKVVRLASGASGTVVATLSVSSGYFSFGGAVSGESDFDGDLVPDVAVAANGDLFDPYYDEDIYVYSVAKSKYVASYSTSWNMAALDATADLDGDGVPDPIAGASSGLNGIVYLVSGADGSRRQVFGDSFQAGLGWSITLLGDRNGDGFRDVAVAAPGGLDETSGSLVVITSGADGSELSRFHPTNGLARGDHQLVAIGDVDGDGVEDLAVISPGLPPGGWSPARAVELRSGADDSLLATIVPTSGTPSCLAAAVDASGTPLLAMTTWKPSGILVYDLRTMSLQTSLSGVGDSTIASVGDANTDGTLDWLVRDGPANACGVLLGGAAPTVLWLFQSGTEPVSEVASTGDLDGDGIDDVLVGAVFNHFTTKDKVTARSGADGSKLFDLVASQSRDGFGSTLAPLGDVNRDGVDDFAVGAEWTNPSGGTGAVYVYSGATGALMHRFEGTSSDYLGWALPTNRWHDAPRVDPDRIPDVIVGSPIFDFESGRVSLYQLTDLSLTITPPDAVPNQSVIITTSGGPPGNLAGLFAVAFDSTALGFFIRFGNLDAVGRWTVTDTVPPGLSGHWISLRSYAVGFHGKLSNSQDAVLTFL